MAEQIEVKQEVVETTPEVQPEVKEPLTFQKIVKMSGQELKQYRSTPDGLAEVEKVLADHYAAPTTAPTEEPEKVEEPIKTDEELLAEKQATEKAEQEAIAKAVEAEAEKKALEEKQRLADEEAAKPKQKIILDFQATDDEGNPIGRRTHLEADTEEEMREKMKDSYINAVRYAERMKKRAAIKPTLKTPETPIEVMSEDQLNDLKSRLESKDEVVVAKAKVELELNEAKKARLEARYQLDYNRGQAASLEFLKKHLEYNNCEANNKILSDFIKSEGLDWTAENLEYAYGQIESQLAPRQSVQKEPEPVVVKEEIKQESKAANPPPAPAPVVAETPAPVAEVPAPAPVEAPAAATNTPAPVRRIPVGGIEPGTLTGQKPKTTGLTKQDVAKMTSEQFKKLMKDPKGKEQLKALGIAVK